MAAPVAVALALDATEATEATADGVVMLVATVPSDGSAELTTRSMELAVGRSVLAAELTTGVTLLTIAPASSEVSRGTSEVRSVSCCLGSQCCNPQCGTRISYVNILAWERV